MTAQRFWDEVWFTIFFTLLTAVAVAFLPEYPLFQFAFLPTWFAYRLLARPKALPLWDILWCGVLCEVSWNIPPFGGILAMLLLWQALSALRENFPKVLYVQHGVYVGLVLAPVIWFWTWIYSCLWMGKAGMLLLPTSGELVAAPVMGALCGGIAFILYRQWDFLCLHPAEEGKGL